MHWINVEWNDDDYVRARLFKAMNETIMNLWIGLNDRFYIYKPFAMIVTQLAFCIHHTPVARSSCIQSKWKKKKKQQIYEKENKLREQRNSTLLFSYSFAIRHTFTIYRCVFFLYFIFNSLQRWAKWKENLAKRKKERTSRRTVWTVMCRKRVSNQQSYIKWARDRTSLLPCIFTIHNMPLLSFYTLILLLLFSRSFCLSPAL